MGGKVKDLSGQKFFRWTVIKQFSTNPIYWLCRCDCGTVRPVAGSSLKQANSKSCGCYKKFVQKIRGISYRATEMKEVETIEISSAIGVNVGRFNFIASSEGIVDRRLFVEKGEVLIVEGSY